MGTAIDPLVRRRTGDMESYDLCAKGWFHYWKLTAEGLDAGLRCFEQALERDPGCAQAHAGVATTYILRATLGLGSAQELMPTGKAAARQALAIDDGIRDAHYALAMVHQCFDWDWLGAEHEFRRKLDVNPGNAEARSMFGLFLLGLGNHDEAVRETRRAVEHDPLSTLAHHMLANVLLGLGRVEEAVTSSRRGVEVAGGFTHAYWSLGFGLSLTQRHDEALAVLREGVRPSLRAVGPRSGVVPRGSDLRSDAGGRCPPPRPWRKATACRISPDIHCNGATSRGARATISSRGRVFVASGPVASFRASEVHASQPPGLLVAHRTPRFRLRSPRPVA